ncbi:MAG: kinase/pyrophosphorylase [Bdellovibrionaceae bacterium]|nr:kinase/pyrophosphorylase [Pseudobdellovibrionaceae bacterium]
MNKVFIYVLSDGTGETAMTMTKAALVHYTDHDFNIVRCKNMRTVSQLETIIDEAFTKKAFIIHTIVSPQLRQIVRDKTAGLGLKQVDLLGPLLTELDQFFNVVDKEKEAGILHSVDEKYYRRVEAIEFTVKHDDGKLLTDLDKSDIVLVGISRTSKTPLSLFLSHKGWRVTNIPLVPNVPLPEELFKIDQRKIVGLIIEPDSLQRIRRNRLEKFGQDPGGDYARIDKIYDEIDYAKKIFAQNKRWPVFNVTERALEETATEILRVVCTRMGFKYDPEMF